MAISRETRYQETLRAKQFLTKAATEIVPNAGVVMDHGGAVLCRDTFIVNEQVSAPILSSNYFASFRLADLPEGTLIYLGANFNLKLSTNLTNDLSTCLASLGHAPATSTAVAGAQSDLIGVSGFDGNGDISQGGAVPAVVRVVAQGPKSLWVNFVMNTGSSDGALFLEPGSRIEICYANVGGPSA